MKVICGRTVDKAISKYADNDEILIHSKHNVWNNNNISKQNNIIIKIQTLILIVTVMVIIKDKIIFNKLKKVIIQLTLKNPNNERCRIFSSFLEIVIVIVRILKPIIVIVRLKVLKSAKY